MNLKECKKFALRKRVELEDLKERKIELELNHDELTQLVVDLECGRDVVSRVGIVAQKEINNVIEELVTQALHAVFGEQFAFKMIDEIKRNQPETSFYIIENGRMLDLDEDSCGGGMADLVSLVLRVVLWAIRVPRTEPVIILDEPLKFLDGVRLDQAGVMIKELSRMLGLQFIIITHEDQLIDCADVMYSVEKRGEQSYVVCLKGGPDER